MNKKLIIILSIFVVIIIIVGIVIFKMNGKSNNTKLSDVNYETVDDIKQLSQAVQDKINDLKKLKGNYVIIDKNERFVFISNGLADPSKENGLVKVTKVQSDKLKQNYYIHVETYKKDQVGTETKPLKPDYSYVVLKVSDVMANYFSVDSKGEETRLYNAIAQMNPVIGIFNGMQKDGTVKITQGDVEKSYVFDDTLKSKIKGISTGSKIKYTYTIVKGKFKLTEITEVIE